MFRLFETIRIMDGRIMHLSWHEERMSRSRKELWNIDEPVDLTPVLFVPAEWKTGLIRCNIFYDQERVDIQFSSYIKKEIRTLQIIECNDIDYHYKYSDRNQLEKLLLMKGRSDEIIIVRKDLITDTTISNLVFFDGSQWFTPARPLLNGTCRRRLLQGKKITEEEIHLKDLDKFKGVKLINSMRDPEDDGMIPLDKISL